MVVKFTSLPAVSPGQTANATIKTAGEAHCSIDVEYASGPSTASGLGNKVAALSGVLNWSWKVGPKTTPGSWPVTVSCTKGPGSGQATKDLTVR